MQPRDKARSITTSEAGRLGGKARKEALTAKQLSESARKAVKARWDKARERAKIAGIPPAKKARKK